MRLNELANNVSGLQLQSGYGGLSSQGYFIRGFESGFETLRNGFKDFGFLSPRDVANVEQVDILKGPAGVLYGSSQNVGGVVNTVTKKPLEERLYQVSMTVGSYNFYRPTLDITGPLTDDKSLLYRLNVAYENADSFRDFNANESIFIAPAFTWKIGARTNLNVEFEYQKYNYTFDRGFPPTKVIFDVPISRFLGEPDYNYAEVESFSATYNFEHEFSDNWRFRQGFNAILVNNSINQETGLGNYSEPYLEPDGQTLPRVAFNSNGPQENYTLQNEVFGKFNTGFIRHNFLFGVELSRYRLAYDFFEAPLESLDIFNPVYGAKPGIFDTSSAEEYGSNNLGIYVQDLIEFSSNFKVLAGVRYDSNNLFYRDTLNNSFDREQSESDFSPRLGIVYQPRDSTSLYASWSNTFNPQFFSRSRSGAAFEPEAGEQFELGIKQDLLNNRLSTTLALFQITKQNVLTPDPEDPDFSVQTGEQTSRGVELDIAGEILPGWKVIATYAYINAFVSEDNNIPVGDRLYAVPRHSASLWTTYELQSGDLQGLGFGAGLVYVGDRETQLPNTDTQIPSYLRADASIFYRRNNYRFGLNFKNLFSTKYYESQRFYLVPGAPFTVLGSVSVEF